jgi:hypothetical protein
MKAESWTVLLLFLAIIAISLWISVASSSSTTNMLKKETFTVVPYQDDSTPIQLVNGGTSNSNSRTMHGDTCQRLSNFPGGGLFCSPEKNTDDLDVFFNAPGDLGSTNSSGLTNSMGPLSLSPDMVKLLSTRGQNATGMSAYAHSNSSSNHYY